MFVNKNYQKNLIIVKNCDLPLANSLENFNQIIKEFRNNENDIKMLAKLRWYIFGEKSVEKNEKVEKTAKVEKFTNFKK
jgi:hypothetical protein